MAQIAVTAPAVDVDADGEEELLEPDEPVGMLGQWWPDGPVVEDFVVADVEDFVVDGFDVADVDDFVVVDFVVEDVRAALLVVVAWDAAVGAELAPAASMPMPVLNPAAPATAASAMSGCLSFITCPFFLSVPRWAVDPCRQ